MISRREEDPQIREIREIQSNNRITIFLLRRKRVMTLIVAKIDITRAMSITS